MEELALRIDAGLLALLDNEVAITRHEQAAQAAKTGANPKKKTRTQVVRDILVEGLRARASLRGEEFPLIEAVGSARLPRAPEPEKEELSHVDHEEEIAERGESTFVYVIAAALPEAIECAGTPRPPTPPRRIGVSRRRPESDE